MKPQTFTETLKEIIGGTPGEVAAKAVIACGVAFWENIVVVSSAMFGYGILLFIDALMGQALARKSGKMFSFSRFIYGPGKKLVLTTGMLLCTSIVDKLIPGFAWLPDNPLFYGAAAFVFVSQLLDVAKKYGTLSGNKFANWLEAKLGKFVKYDEPAQ